jgi:hypothetical protein
VRIDIDDAKFRRILELVGSPPIAFEELAATGRLLQLARSIDLASDPDEVALLEVLLSHLRSLGGPDTLAEPPYIPTDPEERTSVAARLAQGIATVAVRELAYALAYLVIAADGELAPVETSFLEELREAFGVPEDRASLLAEQAAEIVTPPA